jgi:hypothetical protein
MGMALIEVDERIAAALKAQADARSLPVSKLLEEIVECKNSVAEPEQLSKEEWIRIFEDAAEDLPVLPADFSRDDIYSDRD